MQALLRPRQIYGRCATPIEALGAEGAEAQTWDAASDTDGKSGGSGLAKTLQALNEGPESAAARAFTTHVLGSADSGTYRNIQQPPDYSGMGASLPIDTGPSAMTGPMATQVARLLPEGTAAQSKVEGRLAGILQSKAAGISAKSVPSRPSSNCLQGFLEPQISSASTEVRR
jgi:hypothetical protein